MEWSNPLAEAQWALPQRNGICSIFAPKGEDPGRHYLLSKKPKRVIQWISKAWTPYDRALPCFYKETIARLLALEAFRNLIETQAPGAGVTCYSDHLPSIKETSLSNKGR